MATHLLIYYVKRASELSVAVSFWWFLMVLIIPAKAQNYFIENLGQYPESVKYYADIPGGKVFVENNALTYSFNNPEARSSWHQQEQKTGATDHYAVKLKFLDAMTTANANGIEVLPSKYNYFYGKNPENWIRGARSYRKIRINDLFEGTDFEITATRQGLKYDFRLAEGVNPACIRIKYAGAEELSISDNKLAAVTPFSNLNETIPASFAICGGQSRELASNYVLEEDNIVSFNLEPVDDGESIVIDPLLVFSTYSGSPSDNWGNTATYDEEGNAYAGGMTRVDRPVGNYIGDFPATDGAYQTQSGGGWDVAILKFDSLGENLLYATHLGGDGTDVPQSLLVDQNGDLLILGVTSSANFPVTANAYDTTFNGGTDTALISGVEMTAGTDLFVARLSADGSELQESTYLGGTANDGNLSSNSPLAVNYGDESRGDITVDSRGNVLLASRTTSTDFPLVNAIDSSYNGKTDALVISLKPNLDTLNWSTLLGGHEDDAALSIKIDSADQVYVAGGTASSNFPVTTGAYQESFGGLVDGWIAHLDPQADSLIAATFVGTSDYNQTFFLDLDADENVYVAGQTEGLYPVSLGVYSSGNSGQFIHKFSKDLTTSIYSTTIGRVGRTIPSISLTAFLVNDCNNIYLSGWGTPAISSIIGDDNNYQLITAGLPVTADAYQPTTDGSSFYLMVLTGDASELLYATHLGNFSSYPHVDGGTSRFDKHGIVYHAVCASCGGDSEFPTTAGAWSETNGSQGCNNAIFKFDLASLRARIQTNDLVLKSPGLDSGCLPLKVVFENLSTAGEVFEWDFGDGESITVNNKDTLVHEYSSPGTFKVAMRAFDPNTCIAEDITYTAITVSDPKFSVSGDVDICIGDNARLLASGGDLYRWSPVEGLDNSHLASPTASPTDTTTYTVEITNFTGCSYVDSVTVNVIPEIIPKVSVYEVNICEGKRLIAIRNESENVTEVSWSFGDGTSSQDWEADHYYGQDGEYKITGKLMNGICQKDFAFNIAIETLLVPNVLTRNGDGLNDVLKIVSARPVGLSIFSRWGTKLFEAAEYNNDWNGGDLSPGIYFYEVKLYNGEVCNGWIQLF